MLMLMLMPMLMLMLMPMLLLLLLLMHRLIMTPAACCLTVLGTVVCVCDSFCFLHLRCCDDAAPKDRNGSGLWLGRVRSVRD